MPSGQSDSRTTPLWTLLPAIVMAAAILGATWGVVELQTRAHIDRLRDYLQQNVTDIANRLHLIIEARASLANSLAAMVEARDGNVPNLEFRLLGRRLHERYPEIRSLQLAPGGVVRYVYPLEGNERALGHDVLADRRRADILKRAIENRDYVITGPLTLVQGGVAIVARLPIFLSLGPLDEDMFWGFTAVVLDWGPLLDSGGVAEAATRVRLAIRGRDALAEKGDVFYGDPAVFADTPVIADVPLPAGAWQIAAAPLQGWPAQVPGENPLWAGGLALAAIAGWLTHSRVVAQYRLRHAERERETARLKTHDAERVSRAKTRLLASASHDLRQPLQALGLYIALLEREATSPRAAGVIDRLRCTVKGMQDLVGAVLDVSRLDAGMITPTRSIFPIAPLISEIAGEAEPICAGKGLRLRTVHSSALVESDRVFLGTILRNLVQNATKFTQRGTILVGVRAAGDKVRLCVLDSGAGIEPDNLRRIFDEFTQLRTEREQSDSGLGLGLSIVDRLARALDHHVTVDSVRGKGSCFAIEVPRAPAAVAAPDASPIAVSAGR